MDTFVKLLIVMASICATDACVDSKLPHGSVMISEDYQSDSGVGRNDEDKYGVENMTRDQFMVFWTIDYGYRLNPKNDFDTIIFPEFENENILNKFNKFFSNENLSSVVGKRIYCECVGKRLEKGGLAFYKISEARLFAK